MTKWAWHDVSETNMRHDRLGDHFGREPYPSRGRGERGLSPRRVPARSRMPANVVRTAADQDASSVDALHGRCGVSNMRPPSDAKNPRPVSRRGLDYCDDVDMPVICPTWQDLFARSFFESVGSANRHPMQKPATSFPRGAHCCDDGHMPVICPTRQAHGLNSVPPGQVMSRDRKPMQPCRIIIRSQIFLIVPAKKAECLRRRY